MYTWSTDNEDLATIDNEGKATTHGGPGEFTVTAAMVKGAQNYDQAKVCGLISIILSPSQYQD